MMWRMKNAVNDKKKVFHCSNLGEKKKWRCRNEWEKKDEALTKIHVIERVNITSDERGKERKEKIGNYISTMNLIFLRFLHEPFLEQQRKKKITYEMFPFYNIFRTLCNRLHRPNKCSEKWQTTIVTHLESSSMKMHLFDNRIEWNGGPWIVQQKYQLKILLCTVTFVSPKTTFNFIDAHSNVRFFTLSSFTRVLLTISLCIVECLLKPVSTDFYFIHPQFEI